MRIQNITKYFIEGKDLSEGKELLGAFELQTTFKPDTHMPVIFVKEGEGGYELRYANVDEDPQDPRKDHDHLGTMLCFHKRYNLGDEQTAYRSDNYNSWKEIVEAIEENEGKIALMLPLYLYDHSGITMKTRTASFMACDSAGWDWGQVGVIYVTEAKVNEKYGYDNKDAIAKVTASLQAEVEEYDNYLTGEVYGLHREQYDLELESISTDDCCGFFGSKYAKERLMSNDW